MKTIQKMLSSDSIDNTLTEDMKNYFKVYNHRNPCKEWKENQWCDHYLKARIKKFNERVDRQLAGMIKKSPFQEA